MFSLIEQKGPTKNGKNFTLWPKLSRDREGVRLAYMHIGIPPQFRNLTGDRRGIAE